MMPVSKELRDAIANLHTAAHSAVGYVGSANYASREREAKAKVRKAFDEVTALYDTEDERQATERWRDAVAAGKTVEGFAHWWEQMKK